jgi:hypothetical protein
MRAAIPVLFLLSITCFAQCDPELTARTNPKNRDRYSQRGDRCEGVYLEQVSGTIGDLLIASLTASRTRLSSWPSAGPLTLRWNPVAESDVHIQAFPIVPRKFFRLDVVKKFIKAYVWDTSLVEKYLAPAETGIVAWTSVAVNGAPARLYLPVAFGDVSDLGLYRLTLISPIDLSEIYLTITSIVPSEKPVCTRVPQKFASYPADQKIEINLPQLPKPGRYRVEVIGDRKDLGSVGTPPFFIEYARSREK